MARYRCNNVPGDLVMFDETTPVCCSYTDCKPCRAIVRPRLAGLPEPTVQRDELPDPEGGSLPTWDDAFDWGRS